jgi:hypothetical protein
MDQHQLYEIAVSQIHETIERGDSPFGMFLCEFADHSVQALLLEDPDFVFIAIVSIRRIASHHGGLLRLVCGVPIAIAKTEIIEGPDRQYRQALDQALEAGTADFGVSMVEIVPAGVARHDVFIRHIDDQGHFSLTPLDVGPPTGGKLLDTLVSAFDTPETN